MMGRRLESACFVLLIIISKSLERDDSAGSEAAIKKMK